MQASQENLTLTVVNSPDRIRVCDQSIICQIIVSQLQMMFENVRPQIRLESKQQRLDRIKQVIATSLHLFLTLSVPRSGYTLVDQTHHFVGHLYLTKPFLAAALHTSFLDVFYCPTRF